MAAALAAVVVFGATATLSGAVSLPDEAPGNVTQLALDDAAHVQLPAVLVIVTANVPPAAAGDCDVDDGAYVQVVGVLGESFLLHAATARLTAIKNARLSFIEGGTCQTNARLLGRFSTPRVSRVHAFDLNNSYPAGARRCTMFPCWRKSIWSRRSRQSTRTGRRASAPRSAGSRSNL